jgi:GMP synthase-like glutamine amidotransferase
MQIHVLKHVPFEGPASIASWAAERGHGLVVTELFRGAALPDPRSFDLLVVMGGPMSVHDEELHPWLVPEKAFLGELLAADRTVLGVCLGAQLMAEVLGAHVSRNPHPEIGWFPVHWTEAARGLGLMVEDEKSTLAFHWHGETFGIPPGARRLASSEGCPNQAFVHGKSLGLQFHLDMDRPAVEALIANCRDEIGTGPYEQAPEAMVDATPRFHEARRVLYHLLDRFAAAAVPD